jgi:hypothetical protein
VANHDDHTLQIACRTLAFLLPETDNQSDHGWSYVAFCSHGGGLGVRCILDNLGLKAISTLHSSKEQRMDNASVILDHTVLPFATSDPSPANVCTCLAASVTPPSGDVRCVCHLGGHDSHHL